MTIENLYASSHISGTFANPANAVGDTSTTWAGVANTNTTEQSTWAMGNPSAPLTAGATQTINILVRKGTNSGNPNITTSLYENGVLVAQLGTGILITSTTGQTITTTFNSSQITNPANVEIEVIGNFVGGSASTRNSPQIARIQWVADVTVAAQVGNGDASLSWGTTLTSTGTKRAIANASQSWGFTGTGLGSKVAAGIASISWGWLGTAVGAAVSTSKTLMGPLAVSTFKLGTDTVSKLYLGSTQVYPVAAAAFSPTDIAGCTLWLDANDAASITATSGAVSSWADKSATATSVNQATATNKPTTGTRTLNGLNVIDFDGTDDYLRSTGGVLLVDGTTGVFTAFAVVLADTLSGGRSIVDQDKENGTRMPQMIRTSGTDSTTVRIAGSVVTDTGSTLSTATPYILRSIHTASGANVEIFVNAFSTGGTAGVGTNGTAADPIEIGAHLTGSSQWFDGYIAEVIVYDTALGSTDIQAVENYLNDKWAVY